MSRSSPHGSDRRSSTRVQIKLSTSLVLARVDAYYSGMIANLSLGGCYFPIEDDIPLGERCQIEISIGEGLNVDVISLTGQVARIDAHGIGIEFIETSPEVSASLEALLSRPSPP